MGFMYLVEDPGSLMKGALSRVTLVTITPKVSRSRLLSSPGPPSRAYRVYESQVWFWVDTIRAPDLGPNSFSETLCMSTWMGG